MHYYTSVQLNNLCYLISVCYLFRNFKNTPGTYDYLFESKYIAIINDVMVIKKPQYVSKYDIGRSSRFIDISVFI